MRRVALIAAALCVALTGRAYAQSYACTSAATLDGANDTVNTTVGALPSAGFQMAPKRVKGLLLILQVLRVQLPQ